MEEVDCKAKREKKKKEKMRSLRASALRFFFFNGQHMVRGAFVHVGRAIHKVLFLFVLLSSALSPSFVFLFCVEDCIEGLMCVCVCMEDARWLFYPLFYRVLFSFLFFFLLHNGRTVRCHCDSKSYVNNCPQKKLARWQRGGVGATVNCTHVTTIFIVVCQEVLGGEKKKEDGRIRKRSTHSGRPRVERREEPSLYVPPSLRELSWPFDLSLLRTRNSL